MLFLFLVFADWLTLRFSSWIIKGQKTSQNLFCSGSVEIQLCYFVLFLTEISIYPVFHVCCLTNGMENQWLDHQRPKNPSKSILLFFCLNPSSPCCPVFGNKYIFLFLIFVVWLALRFSSWAIQDHHKSKSWSYFLHDIGHKDIFIQYISKSMIYLPRYQLQECL